MPESADFLWQKTLTSRGIGGIAANHEVVVVGSRTITDDADVFTCHEIETGEVRWEVVYPAAGQLDYGNSPRATPLLTKYKAILLGAFGHLTVVNLESGEIEWQLDFPTEFAAEVPTWGFCGSPILLNDETDKPLIVVQPGVETLCCLVALELHSSDIAWQGLGGKSGYSSFVLRSVADSKQLIGYDATSIGGWDLYGRFIWQVFPEREGDFNVPTPLLIDDQLFLTTENNGSRLFQFETVTINEKSDEPIVKLIDQPVATNRDLAPDTHSPVRVGDLICGISGQLYCLNKTTLQVEHELSDPAFEEYASIISNGTDRALILSLRGELLLLEITSEKCEIVQRLNISDGAEVYAHPAVVGNKLFVRFGETLNCLKLESSE